MKTMKILIVILIILCTAFTAYIPGMFSISSSVQELTIDTAESSATATILSFLYDKRPKFRLPMARK
jgi:hypothetical protein